MPKLKKVYDYDKIRWQSVSVCVCVCVLRARFLKKKGETTFKIIQQKKMPSRSINTEMTFIQKFYYLMINVIWIDRIIITKVELTN